VIDGTADATFEIAAVAAGFAGMAVDVVGVVSINMVDVVVGVVAGAGGGLGDVIKVDDFDDFATAAVVVPDAALLSPPGPGLCMTVLPPLMIPKVATVTDVDPPYYRPSVTVK